MNSQSVFKHVCHPSSVTTRETVYLATFMMSMTDRWLARFPLLRTVLLWRFRPRWEQEEEVSSKSCVMQVRWGRIQIGEGLQWSHVEGSHCTDRTGLQTLSSWLDMRLLPRHSSVSSYNRLGFIVILNYRRFCMETTLNTDYLGKNKYGRLVGFLSATVRRNKTPTKIQELPKMCWFVLIDWYKRPY